MRIGLLIHDNVWFCPFISLYIDIIKDMGQIMMLSIGIKKGLMRRASPTIISLAIILTIC